MVMQKKAQFFLLAAVIISAVIISLGFVANKATTNREPGSFYDFSYEVQRETGAVIDYEIYTLSEGNLTDFVNLLAGDIGDRDPDSNFIFIYGNNTGMTLKNYGSDSIYDGDNEVEGGGSIAISSICLPGGSCLTVGTDADDFDPTTGEAFWNETELAGQTKITVTIGANDYSFPISEHKQVIFIIQKETEDENFISVK
ncbi:MAG: hypothetical protein KKF50_03015 [Nanoarchaeota archaeon]|nr:hypothetical protein [Nanoarchaeota archaeon]